MQTFREWLNETESVKLFEKVRRLPDNDIDNFISKNWKSVITLKYSGVAALELSQLLSDDVIISAELDYMHINGDIPLIKKKEVNSIFKKYNVKIVD